MGAAILCAQYIGAGLRKRLVQVVGMALVVNLMLGLAVSVLLFFYAEQLLQATQLYVDDIQRRHGGLQGVSVSPNVGRRDSTLHLTYAFLMLSYNDSTQEEITVPMVDIDGRWCMK